MRDNPPNWPEDDRWPPEQPSDGGWGPPPSPGQGNPPSRPYGSQRSGPQPPYQPQGPAGGGGYPPHEPQRPAHPPYEPQRPAYPPSPGGYPPPYEPQRPAYPPPGGYPPPNEPQRPAYPPDRGYPPANEGYQPRPSYERQAPRYQSPPPQEPPRERERHERSRRGFRLSWSLPIEHIVLGVGVVALMLSLSQPWGVDAQGNTIRLSPIAAQAAWYIVAANVVLGGALILLNKRMGCMALLGCLTLFLIPLVAAAGLGGFQVFSQLHVIPQISPSAIKSTNLGFYLWWGGLAIIVVGLGLQVITHRRKGIIGI